MSGILSIDIWKICTLSAEGLAISLGVSGPVNMGNQTTIISAQHKIAPSEAIQRIYQGTVPGSLATSKKSFTNYGIGWTAHLWRELPRSLFKSFGACYLIPYLEDLHDVKAHPENRSKVNGDFAKVMAGFEFIVAPADWIRSQKHLRKDWFQMLKNASGYDRFAMLSQGSLINSFRQYIIWHTWASTRIPTQEFVQKTVDLDPKNTFSGLVAQSAIQTIPITLNSYPLIERLKNSFQSGPLEGTLAMRCKTAFAKITTGIYKEAFKGVFLESLYIKSLKAICIEEGIKGLMRGTVPKIWAIAFLALGFNYQSLQKKEKENIMKSLSF